MLRRGKARGMHGGGQKVATGPVISATKETEAGRRQVQGLPQLETEFKAS